MTAANIRFLKQEDTIAAGVLDMNVCLATVEQTLVLLGQGKVMNPAKTSLKHKHEDGTEQFKLNSMPVYVGGSVNRAGVKWAGEAPGNSVIDGLPLGIDIMILSDVDTVLPVAIMDATLITAMRTAAVAGTAIEHLTEADAGRVAIFGAGVIGRTLLMALDALDRPIEQVHLFDLDREKAAALAAEFSDRFPVRVASDGEAACRGMDIVITATTAFKKIVDMDWLDACRLRCQCGANEFPPVSMTDVSTLVIDSWDQMVGVQGANFPALVQKGKITMDDVTLFSDLVAGKTSVAKGTVTDPAQFMARGLACLDVAIGEAVYQRATQLGLGTEVSLWDKPIWT